MPIMDKTAGNPSHSGFRLISVQPALALHFLNLAEKRADLFKIGLVQLGAGIECSFEPRQCRANIMLATVYGGVPKPPCGFVGVSHRGCFNLITSTSRLRFFASAARGSINADGRAGTLTTLPPTLRVGQQRK